MAPQQQQQQQEVTATPQLTDEQIIALAQERGLSIGESQEELSTEAKLSAVVEALGGFHPPDSETITPEQAAILENQFKQEVENRLFRVEREVGRKYPDATDDQKFQVAKALIAGDTIGILDATDKIYKTMMEKDKQQTEGEQKNLHVEAESSAGGGSTSREIASLDDVFGPGGLLPNVQHFGQ